MNILCFNTYKKIVNMKLNFLYYKIKLGYSIFLASFNAGFKQKDIFDPQFIKKVHPEPDHY